MKFATHWWGAVFIPETEEDVVALRRIPENSVKSYEEGKAVWKLRENVYMEWDKSSPKFPLGIALVIER